jgi:hypothetical protein
MKRFEIPPLVIAKRWRLFANGVVLPFNRMKIFVFIFLLTPLVSYGQYKLTGVVRDSVTRETIPGVNVIIESQNKGTVTNAKGEFEIESTTESARVTFSFIGFTTVTLTIQFSVSALIELTYDKKLLEEYPNHHVKANLELGYFGDKDFAPYGAILNFSIQSVGQKSIGITSSLKYLEQQENSGFEFSIYKDMGISFLPNLLLSYKSLDYAKNEFGLKQVRGFVSYKLPRFFALDFGGAYNDLSRINQFENLTNEQHFTGTIGLTKIFSYDSFLKNWGLYSNLNYNPNWTYYEIGTYKELHIRKFTSFVLMAKYYDYGTFDGILFSIRFKLFETRYYCCHSWAVYSDDINALK